MAQPEIVSLYEGFFSGGARILHTDIIHGLHTADTPHSVVSIASKTERECLLQLMEDDPCCQKLTAAGIAVSSLGRQSGKEPDCAPFTPSELAEFRRRTAGSRLIAILKEQPVRLLQQAHSDVPAVVCLHRSDPEHQGQALDRLRDGVASGQIAAVTQAARSGLRAYVEAGIPERVMHYVPTGVDLQRFYADNEVRKHWRAKLGIDTADPTVVLAARYDGMKDIPLFLASSREYLRKEPHGHVLACGAGMHSDNPDLQRDIRSAFRDAPHLLGRLRLLGIHRKMEQIYNAADIVALTSSYGEARPLCLIEGLACGAIPVTTDIGDSAEIAADGRGLVVPRDAAKIADAWLQAHDNRRTHRQAIADTRQSFGNAAMIAAYGDVFDQYALR